MKVWIDGIVYALQRHGGISVYFGELLSRLQRDAMPAALTVDGRFLQVAPTAPWTADFRMARPLERYRRCRVPLGSVPTVFHSTYYRRAAIKTLPTVVTVHDFTYERCVRGPRRWVHSAQKFAAIRDADVVICVSQATLDDLRELIGLRAGQQGQVILNGVSDVFRPVTVDAPQHPFVLYVGQRAGYKNFDLLLRAMEHLPNVELRCVGAGAVQSTELAGVGAAVRERVQHTGFVNEAELNRLYNQALCLVYPSRYEGFGIPVVEAMRAGCPVIGVDCKAVREVGAEALIVSADEPSVLARCIERVADDPAYRADRVRLGLRNSKRFSWEDCYRQTRQIYVQLSGDA